MVIMSNRRIAISFALLVIFIVSAISVHVLAARSRKNAIFATYRAISQRNGSLVAMQAKPDGIVVTDGVVVLSFKPSPFAWITRLQSDTTEYETYGIVIRPACAGRKASVQLSHGSD
jgi:hypothetical protein